MNGCGFLLFRPFLFPRSCLHSRRATPRQGVALRDTTGDDMQWLLDYYRSAVGKKMVMAITARPISPVAATGFSG